jgi:hypothetical protein
VSCAGAGYSSGDNLAAFGYEIFQKLLIFIIDDQVTVGTEATDFPAMIDSSFFLGMTVTSLTLIGCHLSTPLY